MNTFAIIPAVLGLFCALQLLCGIVEHRIDAQRVRRERQPCRYDPARPVMRRHFFPGDE